MEAPHFIAATGDAADHFLSMMPPLLDGTAPADLTLTKLARALPYRCSLD